MTHRLKVVVLLLAAASARANTITVNSTADVAANDGQCTLREAITAANTNTASGAMAGECAAGAAGLDTIAFNITGAGVKTITLASTLPTITEAVFINGYTQGVSSANTNALNAGINAVLLIEIDQTSGFLLRINAAGTTIRGIVFNRGADEITVNASNVTIAGNFIGTNPAGTVAMGSGSGFAIRQGSGSNNVIGGPNAADRNLLSGDGAGGIIIEGDDGTLIQGNYIGTDITGTTSLNGTGFRVGVVILGPVFSNTSNTVISGNLISGNSAGGLTISSAGGLLLQGNLIGTQRDGVSALGNGQHGVSIPAGSGNVVGGTSPGQGNIIQFNQAAGVSVQGPGGFSNPVLGNSISSNGNLGITLTNSASTPLPNDACDVDTLPGNKGQNYPAITSASIVASNVTISGTLNSTASTAFRVEFFSNAACDPSGNGEGQTFLGFATVTTDANCNASFGPLVFAVPASQTIFTATATDPANNTSEFSACLSSGAATTATPTPTPSSTPTSTPSSTPPPTPPPTLTNTPAGVPTSTPTVTGAAPAAAVPTLSGGMLLLLGASLALMSLLLIRRIG